MKKIKKKSVLKQGKIKYSFTGRKITKYAGLLPIMKFINKVNIGKHRERVIRDISDREDKCYEVQLCSDNIIFKSLFCNGI